MISKVIGSYLLPFFFILAISTCYSQGINSEETNTEIQEQRLIQYTGKIVDFDTGKPIQGVRVTNLNKELMTLTNDRGFFTIVASPTEKIKFSHLGLEDQYSIIPENSESSKIYEEKALSLGTQNIEAVVIDDQLPPLDELYERLIAIEIKEDPDRELALRNPELFNILDTIIAHDPSLLAFKNGEIESSPISWFYEKIYLKIKEKLPKPKRKELLPVYRKENETSN